MFCLKRKNISNALLSAGKYFEAGKCVFSSFPFCQERFLMAAWPRVFTHAYKSVSLSKIHLGFRYVLAERV